MCFLQKNMPKTVLFQLQDLPRRFLFSEGTVQRVQKRMPTVVQAVGEGALMGTKEADAPKVSLTQAFHFFLFFLAGSLSCPVCAGAVPSSFSSSLSS